MWYAGIDQHKHYSQVCVMREDDTIVSETRVSRANNGAAITALFDHLPEPCEVVFEAGYNWMWLYDVLEPLRMISGIHLANPLHVRIIAAAEIKTDKLDARKLAMLLRARLIPEVHIPGPATRARKLVLRQRMFLVRERTRLRNRIHKLLARQHNLAMPEVSDIFGTKGMAALRKAQVPPLDRQLLDDLLGIVSELQTRIAAEERLAAEELKDCEEMRLVTSVPGLSPITGGVAATEIDTIERFPTSAKLCSYAGVVPRTHSSGGQTWHGRTLTACNKWLKWALVESAWVAVGCSSYFGGIYRRHLQRGKTKPRAIMCVAHRMCHIIWHVLKEQRPYEERPVSKTFPGCSASTLTATV